MPLAVTCCFPGSFAREFRCGMTVCTAGSHIQQSVGADLPVWTKCWQHDSSGVGSATFLLGSDSPPVAVCPVPAPASTLSSQSLPVHLGNDLHQDCLVDPRPSPTQPSPESKRRDALTTTTMCVRAHICCPALHVRSPPHPRTPRRRLSHNIRTPTAYLCDPLPVEVCRLCAPAWALHCRQLRAAKHGDRASRLASCTLLSVHSVLLQQQRESEPSPWLDGDL